MLDAFILPQRGRIWQYRLLFFLQMAVGIFNGTADPREKRQSGKHVLQHACEAGCGGRGKGRRGTDLKQQAQQREGNQGKPALQQVFRRP